MAKPNPETEAKTRRGGLRASSGANSTGRGPVYEMRQKTNNGQGKPLTQRKFGVASGLSYAMVQRCEQHNQLPTHPLAKNALAQYARTIGLDPSEFGL